LKTYILKSRGGSLWPPNQNGSPRRGSPTRNGGNYFLQNDKGISVLFLVIAMLLMVTIGYVFSYLIPAKQKSVIFPVYSTQAFYLAQSGVEFSIRRAVQGTWLTPTLLDANINNMVRTLGPGTFTINYNCPTNTLTSIGAIPGDGINPNVSERRIALSNFTSFLTNPTGLIIDPRSPAQCWSLGTRRARFYIRNATDTSITVTAFSASWSGGWNRRLTDIYMNSTQKYSGSLASPTAQTNFNRPFGGPFSQTIASDVAIPVDIYWSNNITGDIEISFYYRSGFTWYNYTFYLNPCGTGMSGC
jgi:hypothetical protein